MQRKMFFKRPLAFLTALVLLLTMLPMGALSAPGTDVEDDDLLYPYDLTYTVRFIVEEDASRNEEIQVEANALCPARGTPITLPSGILLGFLGWYVDGITLYDFDKPVTSDLVLIAKFRSYLLIQYIDGYGSNPKVIASETISAGARATEQRFQKVYENIPGHTPLTGKIFSYWVNSATGIRFDFVNTVVNSDIVLSPVFINEYAVTFETNLTPSTLYKTIYVRQGDPVTAPINPDNPAYDFVYWSLNSSATPADEPTQNYFRPSAPPTPVTGNIVLYGIWQPITRYIVDFYANGGTIPGFGARYASQGIRFNSLITDIPVDPVWTGKNFAFWSKEQTALASQPEKAFDIDVETVKDDFNLYAIWSDKTCDVKFMVPNSSGGLTVGYTQKVMEGKWVDFTDAGIPLKENDPGPEAGFLFAAWRWNRADPEAPDLTSPSVFNPAIDRIAKDTYLFPLFLDQFQVIYYPGSADAGDVPIDYAFYVLNKQFIVKTNTMPTPLVKAGEEFIGWKCINMVIPPPYHIYYPGMIRDIIGIMRLEAYFVPANRVVSIKYDPNFTGGPGVFDLRVDSTDFYLSPYGHVFSTDNVLYPFLAHHIFRGWSKNNPNAPYNSPDLIQPGTKDIPAQNPIDVYYAIWEPVDYPITYVLNGGTNNPDNPDKYTYDDQITLKNPTRNGYNFLRWEPTNTIPKGSSGPKQFVAVWENDDYPITYILNDGTNHPDNPSKYTVNDEITLKDPTRNGYKFVRWSPTDNIPLGSTGPKQFEAIWEPDEYPITYELEGGKNHPDNPPKYTIEDEIILKNPERDGFIFDGWSPTGEIPKGSTGPKTFKAIWKPVATPPPGGGGGYQPTLAPTISAKPTPTPTAIIDDEPISLGDFAFRDDHVAYIIGYPEGDVRPERNVSRAETATAFYRLITDRIRTRNWSLENPYPDVTQDAWHNAAISVMTKIGVIRGHDTGLFGPDDFITRAELAAIAARFARLMGLESNTSVSFTDTGGHWADTDIRYCAGVGWYVGYTDGSFKPDQDITRAEFMAIVNRMLKRVPETVDDLIFDGMKQWVDNMDQNEWYFLIVQEATNTHDAEYKKPPNIRGLQFTYEFWTKNKPNPDWLALEAQWKAQNTRRP